MAKKKNPQTKRQQDILGSENEKFTPSISLRLNPL